jgi:hypothetical protein
MDEAPEKNPGLLAGSILRGAPKRKSQNRSGDILHGGTV